MARQQQQKSKEACAYISLWEGGDAPRPALKGVLKFTIDQMKEILNAACQEEPDDYDQYSLDVALWEEEDGGASYPIYKGKLSVRKQKEEQPKKRRSTR